MKRVLNILFIFVFLSFTTKVFADEIDECVNFIVENSPKVSTATKMGKNAIKGILGGAVVGALIGASTKDKNNATAGAFIGAIAGGATAAIASRMAYRIEIKEPRDSVIKKTGYDPSKGVVFNILEIKNEKPVVKQGDFVPITIRYIILYPDQNAYPDVFYLVKLYKDGELVSSFYEKITLVQGEVADKFAIPICNGSKSGKYELELNLSSGDIKQTRTVSWEVQ